MHNKEEIHKKARKKEKQLRKDIAEEGGLDKKDMLAMLGSAFAVIFPVCALIIIALGLFMLWLFKAL